MSPLPHSGLVQQNDTNNPLAGASESKILPPFTLNAKIKKNQTKAIKLFRAILTEGIKAIVITIIIDDNIDFHYFEHRNLHVDQQRLHHGIHGWIHNLYFGARCGLIHSRHHISIG